MEQDVASDWEYLKAEYARLFIPGPKPQNIDSLPLAMFFAGMELSMLNLALSIESRFYFVNIDPEEVLNG
jgi:hypothetical protein